MLTEAYESTIPHKRSKIITKLGAKLMLDTGLKLLACG